MTTATEGYTDEVLVENAKAFRNNSGPEEQAFMTEANETVMGIHSAAGQ